MVESNTPDAADVSGSLLSVCNTAGAKLITSNNLVKSQHRALMFLNDTQSAALVPWEGLAVVASPVRA